MRAKEWKRQRKQRRQFIAAGLIAAGLLIAAAFGLYGWDVYRQGYIMTFEGTRVSTNDFRFNLLSSLFSGAEDPKADALDQMLEVMVLKAKADAAGIVLTDEEKDDMLDWARGFKNMYQTNGIDASFISDERLAEILSTELYFEKLMHIETADFVPDEAAFEQSLAHYKENNKLEYQDVQVKFAFSQDFDALEEARAEVEAGTITFDELVERHDVGYDPEDGVMTVALWQLQLMDEDNEKIMALQESEMSEVFTQIVPGEEFMTMYAVVVQVDSITVPPEEEIREIFRERHTLEKRAEHFRGLIDVWKTEADYTVNQRAYDAI
jgi:hypothetical protein